MKDTRKFDAAKKTAYQLGVRWSYSIENSQLYKMIEAKGWRWTGKAWEPKHTPKGA